SPCCWYTPFNLQNKLPTPTMASAKKQPSGPTPMKLRLLLATTLAIGAALAGGVPGCSKPAGETSEEEAGGLPWVEDVTDKVGLDFVHDAGPTGSYFMPQIMASGCALFDFDNNGRLGIYLLQNGGPRSGSKNKLYRQMRDGRFQDISAGSGLDIAG